MTYCSFATPLFCPAPFCSSTRYNPHAGATADVCRPATPPFSARCQAAPSRARRGATCSSGPAAPGANARMSPCARVRELLSLAGCLREPPGIRGQATRDVGAAPRPATARCPPGAGAALRGRHGRVRRARASASRLHVISAARVWDARTSRLAAALAYLDRLVRASVAVIDHHGRLRWA